VVYVKTLYPVKFVGWGEVVDWASGLAEKIEGDGYTPEVIIAVGRGGFVVSRLLCDFLSVDNALAIPIKWTEAFKRPGENYLADLVRGWVKAARENKPVEQSVEEVVKRLRTNITFEFYVDLSNRRVLLVEEIVATGMHMSMAKEFVSKRWGVGEVKTATLVWKSSTAPLFKPDYYLIEPKGFVWFQFPWSRLSDYKQFLIAMLPDLTKSGKTVYRIEDVEKEFTMWYGPKNDPTYLRRALEKLAKEGAIKFLDNQMFEVTVHT
jgi:hypoxanthine phosphoribosyltransferase